MQRATLFILISLVLPLNIHAQKWIDLVNVYSRYSPQNTLQGSDTKRDATMTAGDLKLPVVLDSSNVLIFGLAHQLHSFSGLSDVLAEDQISVRSSMLQTGWEHKWNDDFKLLVMGMTRYNGAHKELKLNDLQQAGLLLATQRKSDRFSWKYGLYYNSEYFGPMIVPLIGGLWKINDHWQLKAVLPINIELAYSKENSWRGGLYYQGINGSYRYAHPLSSTTMYVDRADNNVWAFGEKNLGKNIWIHLKAGHSILRAYGIYADGDQMDLKISAASIGDDRTEIAPLLEDGWSFEFRLIYRLPLD